MTSHTSKGRRVAVVHDWLVTYAGAERVLREILALFPAADLFSVCDFLNDKDRSRLFGKRAQTSFIQRLPFARKRYRGYLPLMPLAIEQLDLSAYDLVISSSYAVAKGVLTGPDQMHVCYCHTPIRYAWDLQHQYLREAKLERGTKSGLARLMLHYVRQWDSRTAAGVDVFLANSRYVARRIHKIYRREATVVYPPVDIDDFACRADKDEIYVTIGRLVPYKRIDLIVRAFARMPERRLIVIGDGPDMPKVQGAAAAAPGGNITVLGYQDQTALVDHLQRARAFVFAAEEDFGIAPVEALACGTPVIAYNKGGVKESVVGLDDAHDGEPPTGVLFDEQTEDAIVHAVTRLDVALASGQITAAACRRRAEAFGVDVFRKRLLKTLGIDDAVIRENPSDHVCDHAHSL